MAASVVKLGVVNRLVASIEELSEIISSSRDSVVEKHSSNASVLMRFASYQAILDRQRRLARDLSAHVESFSWELVFRDIHLINQLSQFLREDAYSLLDELAIKTPAPDSSIQRKGALSRRAQNIKSC